MPTALKKASCGICAFVIVLATGTCLPESKGYRETIPLGTKVVRRGDNCAVLTASATSGMFFKELQRRRSSDGIEFYKGSERVTHFPDHIDVTIEVVATPCTPSGVSVPTSVPGDSFLRALQFHAAWINSSQAAAVPSGFAVQVDRPVFSELTGSWRYRLSITSKGIPIVDKLDVHVLHDSDELAKFELSLGSH